MVEKSKRQIAVYGKRGKILTIMKSDQRWVKVGRGKGFSSEAGEGLLIPGVQMACRKRKAGRQCCIIFVM